MKLKLFSIILILSFVFLNIYGDESCYILKQSLLFYKAQRAGRLPDNDIPWRGNSVLNDKSAGSSVDSNGDGNLSKGYFDAGDGVKFAFPMCYSMTMLAWSYLEFSTNIERCGLGNLHKEVLKWGTDYIIASHLSDNEFVAQVGDGEVDHSRWEPPESINYVRQVWTINNNSPGTDLAMEAASALAATSLVFKTSDPTYSATCLQHATKLHSFAMSANKVKYSDSVSAAAKFYNSGGYNDEITVGSLWMYKATNIQSYKTTAEQYYNNNDVIYSWETSWDNKAVPAMLLLYQITGEQKYKTSLESAFNKWLPGTTQFPYTPGGLAWLRQWAPTRYSLTMAFLQALYSTQYSNSATDKYKNFAKAQLAYCVGNNTKQQSFITSYGPNAPKNPHHRAAHHSPNLDINNPVNNLFQLPGALVGGPDQNDNFDDNRNDYIQSEVALDYNVGLVGTLAAYATGIDSTSTSGSTTSTPNPTTTTGSQTTTSSTTTSTTSTPSPSTTTSTLSTTGTPKPTTTTSGSQTTESTTPKPSTSDTTTEDIGGEESNESINASISMFTNANYLFVLLISLISIIVSFDFNQTNL